MTFKKSHYLYHPTVGIANTALAESDSEKLGRATQAYNLRDYPTAFSLFEQLAEQGHEGAQNDLGYMYEYGKGVTQDDKQAAYWYEKAAVQGNPDAQYKLGFMYENGR